MRSESVPVEKNGELIEADCAYEQQTKWAHRIGLTNIRMLDKKQDKTKQLEIELQNRQERFVYKELEYRKTIKDLQMELRLNTALDQGSSLQFIVQGQSTLGQEMKRVSKLKQLSIREMNSMSQLEFVLWKCIEEIKQEIIWELKENQNI